MAYSKLAAPVPAGGIVSDVGGVVFSTPVMLATQAAQVYHGYKRNKSIGWAIAWALVPSVIGIPLALAQGFGKPKAKK